MTLNEFQKTIERTCPKDAGETNYILNGVLGLTGEAGECSDIVKKHLYQGHPLQTGDLADELGDALWYIALTAKGLGMTLDEIAEGNVRKLALRYPDGFSAERSRIRGNNKTELENLLNDFEACTIRPFNDCKNCHMYKVGGNCTDKLMRRVAAYLREQKGAADD